MSAIFGMLRFDGGEVSPRQLERVGRVLAHRGPDGCRYWTNGGVGIGHRLFRINKEDRFEAQPLHDRKADVTLVADLRLDNREELASAFAIGMAELREMPDSALVMRAYQKWGAHCAEHLLGDFAFAIWDGRARRLVLARDHIGQRYVHYYLSRGFFAFATEIKALWALPEVPRELNEPQLGRFLLADFAPRDGATLFRDISGLPGGTTMIVRPGAGLDKRPYWQPRPAGEHLGRDEAYYVATYRRVLAEAVNCRVARLIAPPALCLSAGYDSAGIAGVCGPLLTAQGRKLIAVSSVLPEGYSGRRRDVRPWVELCRRSMPHLDVRYFARRPDQFDKRQAAACAAADDVPFALSYILDGLYRTAAAAGAGLVMDGIGGDLTLNPRGGMALAYFLRQGDLVRFFRELAAYRRAPEETLWRILRAKVAFPLAPMWARRAWFELRGLGPAQPRRFMAPEFMRALLTTGAVDPANFAGLRSRLDMRETMARDLRELAGRPRSYYANEAAACGLELTRPMLDKRAVEFGLAIPERLYVVKGCRRYLARCALADVYPHEYQARTDYQDMLDPDLIDTLGHAAPRLLAQAERLQRDSVLPRYFALDAFLDGWMRAGAETLDPATATYALRAFSAAAYVDWFGARNE